MKKLPEKTIERLSQYRRTLLNCRKQGKTHVYSHELANLHNFTAVQVRRDVMLMGFSGKLRQGYDVRELHDAISNVLDIEEGQNVALIGIGDLGRAIMTYFNGKRTKLRIVASFDIDSNKVGTVISGVNCHHINQLDHIVKEENISIAILTVPPDVSDAIAQKLVLAGIRGILNYTAATINVASHVYLEDYDMMTSLEKVAYFVKKNKYE